MDAVSPIPQNHPIRRRLDEVVRGLEHVEAVISVATAALKYQDCERDMEVASVLQRNAADRLSVEIERIVMALTSDHQESRPQAP